MSIKTLNKKNKEKYTQPVAPRSCPLSFAPRVEESKYLVRLTVQLNLQSNYIIISVIITALAVRIAKLEVCACAGMALSFPIPSHSHKFQFHSRSRSHASQTFALTPI